MDILLYILATLFVLAIGIAIGVKLADKDHTGPFDNGGHF